MTWTDAAGLAAVLAGFGLYVWGMLRLRAWGHRKIRAFFQRRRDEVAP